MCLLILGLGTSDGLCPFLQQNRASQDLAQKSEIFNENCKQLEGLSNRPHREAGLKQIKPAAGLRYLSKVFSSKNQGLILKASNLFSGLKTA